MNLLPRKSETSPRLYLSLLLTLAASLPGALLGMLDVQVSPVLGSLLFGVAIFGAAFILSWAAEVAQVDISQSLAVAIMALLAVLPEYAVDFVFTWQAGAGSEAAHHYAIANMTGANRLLVGLGWPVILFLFIWAKKKKEILLEKDQRVEIFYLGMATIYSFIIPFKGSLTLVDTLILVTLFGLYARSVARMKTEEPELVGLVKVIAKLKNAPRRFWTAVMFAYSGFAIFFVAEPFAGSLVETGHTLGINEFLLVQWLAPLASEAPEFIIAATWTLRGQAGAALRALISSKVNQWTLLIGTIPLVYAISGGAIKPFVLDNLQQNELFLTAAQSLFAVAVLVSLRLSRTSGILLLTLFTIQLIVAEIRVEVTYVYLGLAAIYLFLRRGCLLPTVKTGLGIK